MSNDYGSHPNLASFIYFDDKGEEKVVGYPSPLEEHNGIYVFSGYVTPDARLPLFFGHIVSLTAERVTRYDLKVSSQYDGYVEVVGVVYRDLNGTVMVDLENAWNKKLLAPVGGESKARRFKRHFRYRLGDALYDTRRHGDNKFRILGHAHRHNDRKKYLLEE